ncbi:Dynamin family protein [Roseovarius azorensis]|uniref:Dynamin family protein n=1 Tax=Roseovarius azorensis TaxID=1287727 RepID=A0A1H7U132_9RHOB|nr:dynamin family protein [Roseovarius azorensis]SEL90386.1 Dynamin family protein [Roseovarius azorensis]
MSEENLIRLNPVADTRKPRLVLMGEFSAGKSTLSNILLGCNPLPMRVTATRLPPVVISQGQPAAFTVGHDGVRTPIALDNLESVSLSETRRVELSMESDALELCDIVDMPGISDPNMPPETWQNVIRENDLVIWCTHATQAWRKSEAAIWDSLRAETSGRNLLLITQFDKLQNQRDQDRVLKRVQRETEGLFEAIYPVSLLVALNADDDIEAWRRSGAAEFLEHVIGMLLDFEHGHSKFPTAATHHADDPAATGPVSPIPDEDHEPVTPEPANTQTEDRVMPRRVRLSSDAGSRRNADRRAASRGG